MLFLIVGLWLFWRAHHDLGTNWSPSVELNAQQTLVTEGVYRVVRHPMYTSQMFFCAGQALLLQNWIAGLLTVPAFLLMVAVRVPPEERMLLEHFGEEYRAYRARTGGILPRWP